MSVGKFLCSQGREQNKCEMYKCCHGEIYFLSQLTHRTTLCAALQKACDAYVCLHCLNNPWAATSYVRLQLLKDRGCAGRHVGRRVCTHGTSCGQIHPPHATFSHAQSLHSTDDMRAWLQLSSLSCAPKTLTSSTHYGSLILCCTRHWALPHDLFLPPLLCCFRPPPTPGLLSTHPSIHCGDPRQDGTSAEYQLLTGDEPKRVELNRTLFNLSNQEIDDQDDIEETDFKPMSFSQSLIHSAYDSAESIATPPDSDLEDEQLRMVLASPLKTEVSGKPDAECVQKREANAQRVQAYHSRRESLTSSSSRDLEASGQLVAVFSCHSESSQNTFSERDRSNEPGNRFESSVHSVLRIAGPAKVGKSLLGGNKDHLLNQARSERMKQEHQVGSLNYCIDELQKTNNLMLQDWNWRTPITDALNLDENKFDYKKN